MPIQEEQVEQAFLRLYFKLKCHGVEIFTQLISDLRTARNGSLLWGEDIVELNKQISDIASQERLLTQLKQQGVVDPDIFISRSNLLAERRRELKLKKERILHAEEDHTIQRTRELIDVLESGPDWLEAYDEELFSELVEKIIIQKDDRIWGMCMLRHNAASTMVQNSIPLATIAAILGHAGTRTTDIYGNTAGPFRERRGPAVWLFAL